jgi:hypothetical protein
LHSSTFGDSLPRMDETVNTSTQPVPIMAAAASFRLYHVHWFALLYTIWKVFKLVLGFRFSLDVYFGGRLNPTCIHNRAFPLKNKGESRRQASACFVAMATARRCCNSAHAPFLLIFITLSLLRVGSCIEVEANYVATHITTSGVVSCALLKDGNVKCWGGHGANYGEVGVTPTATTKPYVFVLL